MKKIKLILATAAAVFTMSAVSAQTVSDVQAKFNQAAELINAKNYAEAIPALESVVDMGLDAGAEAMDIVQQAQKLLPTCYFQQGLALCRESKFEEAIPYLNNAVVFGELYGDARSVRNAKQLISQAYIAMGGDAFNNKDYAKAIEIFSKGYEANPTDTTLALFLAESYSELEDYENGLRIYREIAELESRHSRYQEPAVQAKEKLVYYQMIQASDVAKTGDTQASYDIFENILALDPENAHVHLMRIQTANNAQDFRKVIEWGERAAEVQDTPENKSEVYFLMGAAYQNTDNKDAAIANYRKVTGPKASVAKQQIDILSK